MSRYCGGLLNNFDLATASAKIKGNSPKATLCYAMLRYATLCYAMLRYATLCYAMLRYATLCYAMLRYATLRSTFSQKKIPKKIPPKKISKKKIQKNVM
jgi:uncharacterized protein YjbI with pentapeptide repeats